jgi:hypothetical protein
MSILLAIFVPSSIASQLEAYVFLGLHNYWSFSGLFVFSYVAFGFIEQMTIDL